MGVENRIAEMIAALKQAFAEGSFIQLSLGNYTGAEEQLKQLIVRKVLIRKEEMLGVTYRFKTRDVVKNYALEQGVDLIDSYLHNGFDAATLFTGEFDLIFQKSKSGVTLKKKPPTKKPVADLSHDRQKQRIIATKEKPYLTDLKITDREGNVFKHAQDKYRQINHYIDILSSLIKDIPSQKRLRVVDMGSGKGYLTFALYEYLTQVLQREADVIGVEFRNDLVTLCNQISERSGFNQLHFTEGTIAAFDSRGTDVLIALHACDTATDDALYKGIMADSDLIVVAPCCHKQVRREMEKQKIQNDVGFLTQHGIFMERQAEMVTDGIRALILEYYGYKTKVFEFISDSHTPKNVMITAIKSRTAVSKNPEILHKISAAKSFFGLEYHYLERMLGM